MHNVDYIGQANANLDLCHKGPCRSCLEAVFEDISCACGRTVLQPPQPCGSQAPPCHFDCTRRTTCQHPPTKHQCHPDTVSCPKCSYLVEKPCICGKRTLKNQPCWFTEVRCGLPCGKKLKCGNHFCQLQCHRHGQCEDSASPCTQLCGRVRQSCEHMCSDQVSLVSNNNIFIGHYCYHHTNQQNSAMLLIPAMKLALAKLRHS